MKLLEFKTYQIINILLFSLSGIFGIFFFNSNNFSDFQKIVFLSIVLIIIFLFLVVKSGYKNLSNKISFLPKRLFFILTFGILILFSFQAYILGFSDFYQMLAITIITPLLSFLSILFTKLD